MRAQIRHVDFQSPQPNACEATIPAPTAEHRERILVAIHEFGCELRSETATTWTFNGAWRLFKPLMAALDDTMPWFPEGDRWGLHSTFVERVFRFPVGFACWVIEDRGGRVRVLGQLIDGRWARAWVRASRVGEREVVWLPVELRRRCAGWATREEAEKVATQNLASLPSP
jgi:hypothetical protein